MAFFASLFRSLVASLIVTVVISIIGLSLFVGHFPPSFSQVKNVFEEYKKILQFKQQLLEQNKNLDGEKLADSLQKGPTEQFRKLSLVRGDAGAELDLESKEEPATATVSAEKKNQQPDPPPAEIPRVWQEQFYQLRSEVFRLNQRVAELEKQKKQVATSPLRK